MKKLIPTIGAVTGLLAGMPCLNAGGPALKVERSVKVSFDSEVGKSYNAYSTTDVAKKKWELLGGPVDGTGEKIVFFYQSNDDQKVFFKVDEADGSGGGGDSAGIDHQWSDTSLRIKKANGDWGNWVDLRGPSGDRGERGPRGDAGPIGPRGDQGLVGSRGDQGAQGSAGERGPAGPQGERGIKGAMGTAGPQGERGPQGPAGDGNGSGGFTAENWENRQNDLSGWTLILYNGLGDPDDAPFPYLIFLFENNNVVQLSFDGKTKYKGSYSNESQIQITINDAGLTGGFTCTILPDNFNGDFWYGNHVTLGGLANNTSDLQYGRFQLLPNE